MSKKFELDDLVWAKMKGFSPWPGIIVKFPPSTKSKKNHQYVLFFGSNDYASVSIENINLHSNKMLLKYGTKRKDKLFKSAVENIIKLSKGSSKYYVPETINEKHNAKDKKKVLKSHKAPESFSSKTTDKEDTAKDKKQVFKSDKAPESFSSKTTDKEDTAKDKKQVFKSDKAPESFSKKLSKTTDKDTAKDKKNTVQLNEISKTTKEEIPVSFSKKKLSSVNSEKHNAVAGPSNINDNDKKYEVFLNKTVEKNIAMSSSVNPSVNTERSNCVAGPSHVYDNGRKYYEELLKKANPQPVNEEKLEESLDRIVSRIRPYCKCMQGSFINSEIASIKADGVSPPDISVFEKMCECCFDSLPPNLTYKTKLLKKKKTEPLDKTIGFLGLSNITQGIAKNLCHIGAPIVIWDQTHDYGHELVDNFQAKFEETAAGVIDSADVIFLCFSRESIQETVFGKKGIIKKLKNRSVRCKSFVLMTTIDHKISENICKEITKEEGRYLEAPFCGSESEANKGSLVIFAAGNKSLYEELKTCFDAVSKRHEFLSEEVGMASKIAVTVNNLYGSVYSRLTQALSLANKYGLIGNTFLDILKDCDIIHNAFLQKVM